jgi:D-alanyl-D-alanine dipeptidase
MNSIKDVCLEYGSIDCSLDKSGFVSVTDVISDVILEIRYFSTYNFVGKRIDSYEAPIAYLTKEAALALKKASEKLKKMGYLIKIYDGYRPQSAVSHFSRWAKDIADTEMKPYFYPDVDKSDLFALGYIAEKSGHSRGSAVDVTLVNMMSGREVDMGCKFDFFGDISHAYRTEGLTNEQIENRALLRRAMMECGFKPLDEEWWHFSLEDEPYPDTYFDFPVTE